MKASFAYALILILICYAIGFYFGDDKKEQLARKLRGRDDIETVLQDATN